MPIRTNAQMNANASSGIKVLPIAKIPIKKTGKLSTNAEATGNNAAGRQPPSRFLNQYNDGAYASEKTSAAMMSEATVAFPSSTAFTLPSTKLNASNRTSSPINQDASDMQISFMGGRIQESGVRIKN